MVKKSENLKLNKAREQKDDEYYTYLSDISQEVCKYKDQLKGKVILMPCDDPELIKVFPENTSPEDKASQFWVYFHKQFDHLGLKKIMATHYSGETNDSYLIEYGGGSMTLTYWISKKLSWMGMEIFDLQKFKSSMMRQM